eukprot:s1799_g7.t3
MRLDPGKRTSGFERRVRAPKAQFGTRMQRLSWDELRRVFALEGYDQQLLPSQMPLDSAFGPRCAKGSPGGALLEAPDAWPGRLGVHLVSHTDSSTTSAPEAEVQKVPPPMAEPSLLEEFQKDLPSQASKPSLPKAMPWLPAPSVPKAKIQNVPHCMAEPSLLEEFRAPNGLLPAWPNTSGSQQPAAAKATPWVPSAAPSLPCAKANGGPCTYGGTFPAGGACLDEHLRKPAASGSKSHAMGAIGSSQPAMCEGPCTYGGTFPAGGVKQGPACLDEHLRKPAASGSKSHAMGAIGSSQPAMCKGRASEGPARGPAQLAPCISGALGHPNDGIASQHPREELTTARPVEKINEAASAPLGPKDQGAKSKRKRSVATPARTGDAKKAAGQRSGTDSSPARPFLWC